MKRLTVVAVLAAAIGTIATHQVDAQRPGASPAASQLIDYLTDGEYNHRTGWIYEEKILTRE
jgi:hypothetical protein